MTQLDVRKFGWRVDCLPVGMTMFLRPPNGKVFGSSHDVGEWISWPLRPVISVKLNLVTHENGFKEDYPNTKALPKHSARRTRSGAINNGKKHCQDQG